MQPPHKNHAPPYSRTTPPDVTPAIRRARKTALPRHHDHGGFRTAGGAKPSAIMEADYGQTTLCGRIAAGLVSARPRTRFSVISAPFQQCGRSCPGSQHGSAVGLSGSLRQPVASIDLEDFEVNATDAPVSVTLVPRQRITYVSFGSAVVEAPVSVGEISPLRP